MAVHSGHPLIGVLEAILVHNGVDSVVVVGGSGQVIRQEMAQTWHSLGDGNRNRFPWKACLRSKAHHNLS